MQLRKPQSFSKGVVNSIKWKEQVVQAGGVKIKKYIYPFSQVHRLNLFSPVQFSRRTPPGSPICNLLIVQVSCPSKGSWLELFASLALLNHIHNPPSAYSQPSVTTHKKIWEKLLSFPTCDKSVPPDMQPLHPPHHRTPCATMEIPCIWQCMCILTRGEAK